MVNLSGLLITQLSFVRTTPYGRSSVLMARRSSIAR